LFVGLHFTCRLKIMLSYSGYPYFVRTTKAAFWEDRKRVKKLTELYQSHICLRDRMQIADYKHIAIKKIAKEEIETHFGLLGDLCVIVLHI